MYLRFFWGIKVICNNISILCRLVVRLIYKGKDVYRIFLFGYLYKCFKRNIYKIEFINIFYFIFVFFYEFLF